MHASDAATTHERHASQSPAARRLRRAKVTNNPMVRTNGNTAEGKRTRDLFHAFMAETGKPDSDVFRAAALAAAELTVAAESMRSKVLAGAGDVEQLVRIENLASRAVRRLGIKPGAPKAEHVPLREVLQREATEASDGEVS